MQSDEKVNLDTLSVLAEVIASAAVVISLVYLAVQIRQNTRATRSGASSYIDEALARILSATRGDAEFTDIWLRGCRDLELLDEVERVRFTSHLLEMLNLAEYVHQLEKQQLSGTHIDYIPWVALLNGENPGIRTFVDSLDNVGSPDLTARITDTSQARGSNVYGANAGNSNG